MKNNKFTYFLVNLIFLLSFQFSFGQSSKLKTSKSFMNTDLLNIHSLNAGININQTISTTITNNGRIGFEGAFGTQGLGFVFQGAQLLFEGAPMFGFDSNNVLNSARNVAAVDNDFIVSDPVKYTSASSNPTIIEGEFVNIATKTPNMKISQRAIYIPNSTYNNMVFYNYLIENESNVTFPNFYSAMFFDPDINNASQNFIEWNNSTKLGYAYSDNGFNDYYFGVKLLNTGSNITAPPLFYPMSQNTGSLPTNGFTTSEKFTSLSNGIFATNLGLGTSGLDAMFSIGRGPYLFEPGDVIELSFAVIASSNLADLLDDASDLDQGVGFFTHSTNSNLFSKINVYPNPIDNKTFFEFQVKNNNSIEIQITNVLGELVESKTENMIAKGNNLIELDLSNLTPGLYMYTFISKDGKQSGKIIKN